MFATKKNNLKGFIYDLHYFPTITLTKILFIFMYMESTSYCTFSFFQDRTV